MNRKSFLFKIGLCLISLFGTATFSCAEQIDLRKNTLSNETAYIPSQCYTKTQDEKDKTRVYNPCYVCHTRSVEPNYVNDFDLQQEYSFPEPALENPWKNLLEDRSQRVAAISDREILDYVKQDNYLNPEGELILSKALNELPENWDANSNGRWDGYLPDCYFNFDKQGFDIAPNGDESGWRAFAYYPFPGTFWPTNGSTDDVLIRLADAFHQNESGHLDRETYRINLAIVEAVVKGKDVAIDVIDESKYDVDLNRNGRIDRADKVVFDWKPLAGRFMSYVGMARIQQKKGRLHLAQGLFPEGTEFLHSVRYIDLDADENIGMAKRMKELRYMKKRRWQTYADLEDSALEEMKESDDFPDRISQYMGNAEQGLGNGTGWVVQGFIEDQNGDLRPQTFEETVFCIGCHGGIGSTSDSVYSFSRKLNSYQHQQGWYHWTQKSLKDLDEPKIEISGSGVFYEYTYYLMYNRSGNEFRDNQEVIDKFFNPDGTMRENMTEQLHEDITLLLNPSPQRALVLNKAYRSIVEDQDFTDGRDANLIPVASVYDKVEQDLPTGVQQASNVAAFGECFGPGCDEKTDAAPLSPKLTGQGMNGPNGNAYESNWEGIIRKSRYAIDIKGVYFTFPERLTLPTREIVPVAGGSTCYRCHRLGYPATSKGSKGQKMVLLTEFPAHKQLPDNVTRLTHSNGKDTNAIPSPNGKQIAFTSDRDGSNQIWLMDTDGKNQRQLTKGTASHAWPQWSPDSKQLVVWSEDNGVQSIHLIDVKTAKQKAIVNNAEKLDRPTFHPDGQTIAYAAEEQGNWDIWLYHLANGHKTRLTNDPQMESNPLWSQDGLKLGYKVAPSTGTYNLTGQNFIRFEAGLNNPQIFQWDGPQSVQMNSWSPAGDKIAYTAEVINNASGQEKVTYSAVVSNLNLNNGTATALEDKLLANGASLGDRGPVFSPDGTMVAFWGWNMDNSASLWLYDVASGESTRLTSGGVDMYPQWSRDGRKLFFESNIEGQIELMTITVEPSNKLASK